MARDNEDRPRMPQAQHRGGKDSEMKRQTRKHPYTGVDKGKLEKVEPVRIGNGPKKKDKRAQDLKDDQKGRPKGAQHAKSGGCAVATIGLLGGAALVIEEAVRWLV